MGIQYAQDATLIRHAYVCTVEKRHGIGGKLVSSLCKQTASPILIGTWADAVWAVHLCEKDGFRLVSQELNNRLLRKYWSIPERQIETSVVLANQKWFDLHETEAINL